MSSFDQALAYVTDALAKNRALGDSLGEASLTSLQALIKATGLQTPGHRRPVAAASSPSATAEAPASQSQERPRLGLAAQFRATVAEQKQPLAPPIVPAPLPAQTKEKRLEALFARLPGTALPGQGSPDAALVIVNHQIDPEGLRAGRTLSGEAGLLLDKIILAMGLKQEEIYSTNLLKSVAPEDQKEEAALLIEELAILQPKCIVALGENVTHFLTQTSDGIEKSRGKWHDFKGIPLMPTFTLQHLLENQTLEEKRKFWEDQLQVLELLGRRITPKQRSFFLPKE